ncbi:MAG TPA: M13 family metallopeptidase [Pyrinomonadaceae bacterium]|nr:M13 family metallopeptidase [Pyrinomonadaceae bacterium]
MRFPTSRFFLALLFATLLSVIALVLQVSPKVSAQAISAGINPANMCNTCNACEDFYMYANGSWLAKNEIPAAFSTWGTTSHVREKNVGVLRQILEEAAKNTNAPAGSVEQKTGDFFASCMDEPRIEAAGAKPLAAELAAIDKMKSVKDLPAMVGHLHDLSVRAVFNFGAVQDFKNSSVVTAIAGQGGLGLPDRDFYFKDDPKSKSIRDAYLKHVANMFKLLGDDAARADGEAQVVMKIETDLASNSLDRVARRDLSKQYNKMTVADLGTVTPNFDWNAYLKALNAPKFTDVNMAHPAFFKGLTAMLGTVSVDDWKIYLRWRLVHDAADALSSNFVNENFDFYGKTLNGTKELLPRWRRCVMATDGSLGELLGQVYVKKAFPPEAKARMKELVNNLTAALREDIKTLDWMSEPTQQQAIAKLESFAVKIGYPDKWRDYSALKIDRNSFADNLMRAGRFEVHRGLNKIGKPVDKTEWGMTPPTVNAYYNPLMAEIVFPAGILQPPYFDPTADDAVNYGAIGGVIGHEMSHGFDDQGRKFDMKGNMADWWTETDAKNYMQRATCVEEQFSGFRAEEVDMNQNGKLVLGESIGDLGGLKIAWLAFQKSLEGKPRPANIDGFTPEQRFFLGWAQVWGRNQRPEAIRQQILTDPHPLGRFRVNGPISNMPQFAEAFNCKLGDKMVRPPDKRCQVW